MGLGLREIRMSAASIMDPAGPSLGALNLAGLLQLPELGQLPFLSCVGQPSDAGFTGRKETSSQGSSQESLTAEGDLCFLGRMGGDHSIWYTDMEAGMFDS